MTMMIGDVSDQADCSLARTENFARTKVEEKDIGLVVVYMRLLDPLKKNRDTCVSKLLRSGN